MTPPQAHGEASRAGQQQPGTAGSAEATGQPHTGNSAVDQACASVAQLSDLPHADHHDLLAAAHEALHDALNAAPDSDPQDA